MLVGGALLPPLLLPLPALVLQRLQLLLPPLLARPLPWQHALLCRLRRRAQLGRHRRRWRIRCRRSGSGSSPGCHPAGASSHRRPLRKQRLHLPSLSRCRRRREVLLLLLLLLLLRLRAGTDLRQRCRQAEPRGALLPLVSACVVENVAGRGGRRRRHSGHARGRRGQRQRVEPTRSRHAGQRALLPVRCAGSAGRLRCVQRPSLLRQSPLLLLLLLLLSLLVLLLLLLGEPS